MMTARLERGLSVRGALSTVLIDAIPNSRGLRDLNSAHSYSAMRESVWQFTAFVKLRPELI
jgi:hypothetical protein